MGLLLSFPTASLFGLIVASISTSSMVAEIVEAHDVDHGTRIEGVFFSGYLMTQKFGQALAIFLVGQLVAYVGLTARMRTADWPADTARTLAWIFAGLMILTRIMATVGPRLYAIDRASPEAPPPGIAPTRPAAPERTHQEESHGGK